MGQTVSGHFALRDTPAHRPSQLSPVSVVTDMFVRPCPALVCFLGPGVAPLKNYTRCHTEAADQTCYILPGQRILPGQLVLAPTIKRAASGVLNVSFKSLE